ncbi:ribbon-helix-helix protein, CopG family [Gallionella capsiferriformans]|uniref:Ribbon-helix-helix protein CopG domain-containing protein n=1 Tax=Gallionella capsiferriformans (strain ES-2) TaxID=395494 RepID=D9SII1_GALCS|nr:ribbon-helix-helix protein, CopG family [Gallionella capsiferriformans]ADL56144.1 hypothetical protein Galf_2139 [Gallionella capsiferriformans ES-2]
MSKHTSIRLQPAELAHVREQAIRLGVSQAEIIRQSIWRDAAVAEIRDETKAAVQKEFDMLFAKLAVEFETEVESMKIEIETLRQESVVNLSETEDQLIKAIEESRESNKNNLKIVGNSLMVEIQKLTNK